MSFCVGQCLDYGHACPNPIACTMQGLDCMIVESEHSEVRHEASLNIIRAGASDNASLRAELAAGRQLAKERANKTNGRKAGQTKRAHRPTVDNDENVQLINEIKLVFGTRFEDRQDERVMATDLREVFLKHTAISYFDENIFKYHSKSIFLQKWTSAQISTYKGKDCYVGVAVINAGISNLEI